ncbi:hypothetical protein ACJJTC_009972 [Scirpophaga incertulas]
MQSLSNKTSTLESFLDSRPSVYQAICISETWLTKGKSELINFTAYNLASSFYRQNCAGGGVCILLHEDLEFNELKEIMDLSQPYRKYFKRILCIGGERECDGRQRRRRQWKRAARPAGCATRA